MSFRHGPSFKRVRVIKCQKNGKCEGHQFLRRKEVALGEPRKARDNHQWKGGKETKKK